LNRADFLALRKATPLSVADPRAVSKATSYGVVHGWPILPTGKVLGAISGVDVDRHNRVHVFHRAGRTWPASDVLDTTPIAEPTITIFDGLTGRVIHEWGEGLFAMPHGLTVDAHGNTFLTDVALQQVYKFSAAGALLFAVGERGIAGNDATHFNRPTAIATLDDGSFFVSDGYRNARVMKFAHDGRFLFEWGSKGSNPAQFDLPHGVSVHDDRVYVADRSNERVQVFNMQGEYIEEWRSSAIGRPYSVAVRGARAYIADGGDQPNEPPDRSALVITDDHGQSAVRIGRFGRCDGQFEMAHDLALGPDGAVYVGDITGGRIQKFVAI
jgi:peptidylamidoglycolate lyase